MAMTIESYKGSYPAAYYEIGTIYSFYATKNAKACTAKQEYVDQYSYALKDLERQLNSNAIQPVQFGASSSNSRLSRYYAIVVNKTATNIEVMFQNNDRGIITYLTRCYAVSKQNIATDGQDLMAPTTSTTTKRISRSRNVSSTTIGGITKSQSGGNTGNVGGVTKAGRTSNDAASIGGVTLVKKAEELKAHRRTHSTTITDEPKVGGITRVKHQDNIGDGMDVQNMRDSDRVGGVTRMNK